MRFIFSLLIFFSSFAFATPKTNPNFTPQQIQSLLQYFETHKSLDPLVEASIQRFIEKEKNRRNQSQAQAVQKIRPISEQDHIFGPTTANVSIIVYSDYECPFCKTHFESLMKAYPLIQAKHPSFNIVYRHLPLSFHGPEAIQSAYASECIAQQAGSEGFFKFTRLWFESSRLNGQGLPAHQSLSQLAEQSGATDLIAFQACLKSPETVQRIEQDLINAQELGIKGTPSNIVLDHQTGKTTLIPGTLPNLEQALNELLSHSVTRK